MTIFPRAFRTQTICFGIVGMMVALAILPITAQDQPDATGQESQNGIGLLEPTTELWEMGLEIRAGGGRATGIRAMAPVPVDWPEQVISIVREEKSNHVSGIEFDELDGAVQQMLITIPRLNPGDVARAVVIVEVKKQWITAPEETSQLQFATRLDRHTRKYLAPSPYIESRDRRIVALSEELFEANQDEPAWIQIERLYDWVRENVEYRFDEQIKPCVDALEDGYGDCEELSSLFIALCRANGVPARAVWIPGHTYPEFYLQDEQGNGHWFPCQAAGTREFGAMSEDKPILQKGDRFRIHGHRESMRYVQPTLTARDATANPTVTWILRRIDE